MSVEWTGIVTDQSRGGELIEQSQIAVSEAIHCVTEFLQCSSPHSLIHDAVMRER